MEQRILVLSAHEDDHVWSCGGTIAKYARDGYQIHLISLSRGACPEFGDGREGGRSHHASYDDGALEAVSRILGIAEFECWDLADWPMMTDNAVLERLACRIREIRPLFILTHDKEADALNPDHETASEILRTAYTIASGAGAYCEGFPVAPRQTPMFGFEPCLTELSKYRPGIYIDITEVFDAKLKAMQACSDSEAVVGHYTRRAESRAFERALVTGAEGCRYAETFSSWGAVCAFGHFVW